MLKVLLIDDDEIVLFVQQKMLQNCEISSDPLKFKSASTALDFLSTQKEPSEFLIFLDINMPGMSGWEFLERLETVDCSSEIYVIMVTSSIASYDKSKSEDYLRVIDFIEKPIKKKDCEKIKSHSLLRRFF